MADIAMGLSLSLTRTQWRPQGSGKTEVNHTHTHTHSCLDSFLFHLPSALFHPSGRILQCHFSPTLTVKSLIWKRKLCCCIILLVLYKTIQLVELEFQQSEEVVFAPCNRAYSSWAKAGLAVDWSGKERWSCADCPARQWDRIRDLSWHLAQHTTGGWVNLTVQSQGVTSWPNHYWQSEENKRHFEKQYFGLS